MNAAFVIDCSITMAWCFADEATAFSNELLDRLEVDSAVVPSHWFLEVMNVLAMAEKRKRITAAKSSEFITLLETLEIEVDEETADRAFAYILPLCRGHGLTSYDAAYLELALRSRMPLATLDTELRAGAKSLGVKLVG